MCQRGSCVGHGDTCGMSRGTRLAGREEGEGSGDGRVVGGGGPYRGQDHPAALSPPLATDLSDQNCFMSQGSAGPTPGDNQPPTVSAPCPRFGGRWVTAHVPEVPRLCPWER